MIYDRLCQALPRCALSRQKGLQTAGHFPSLYGLPVSGSAASQLPSLLSLNGLRQFVLYGQEDLQLLRHQLELDQL